MATKGSKPPALQKLSKIFQGLGQAAGTGLGIGGSPPLNQQFGNLIPGSVIQSGSIMGTQVQQGRLQVGQSIMTPPSWTDYLDGREPTVDLALAYLDEGSYDWGKPLTFLMRDFHSRLREIENQYPWQKSYEQIADEKEAVGG